MSEPNLSPVTVQVDPLKSAYTLRELGGWGVSVVFLMLLYFVWRYFTRSVKSSLNGISETIKSINDTHQETIRGYVDTIAQNERNHTEELNVQRNEIISKFTNQQNDLSELLERRHEQFIQLIKDNQTTIASAIELNRQEVDLMSRLEEELKDIERVITSCKKD
jgi:transcription initiation factor IIF auxiliary subunit